MLKILDTKILSTPMARLFISSLFINVCLIGFFALVSQPFGKFPGTVCRWDCGWYSDIVLNGYDHTPPVPVLGMYKNYAFFPFFPLLMHYIRAVIHLSFPTLAIIANATFASVMSTVAVYYMKERYSFQNSNLIIVLFSMFPYSFYFIIPYTEAIYGLALIAFTFLLYRRHWWQAGLAGVVLSATRPTGSLIIATLCILTWLSIWFRKNTMQEKLHQSLPLVGTAVISSAGLLAYMTFLQIRLGDPFAFAHAEIAWGRGLGFTNPLVHVLQGLQTHDLKASLFVTAQARSQTYLAGMALAGLGIALWGAWRGFYTEAALLIVTFCAAVGEGPLESSPRYLFANPAMLCILSSAFGMFPPFIRQVMLLLCAMLQAVFLVLWSSGLSAFLI
ncbi:MAG: hypothetical protein ABF785_09105 [Acetobacter papayae]